MEKGCIVIHDTRRGNEDLAKKKNASDEVCACVRQMCWVELKNFFKFSTCFFPSRMCDEATVSCRSRCRCRTSATFSNRLSNYLWDFRSLFILSLHLVSYWIPTSSAGIRKLTNVRAEGYNQRAKGIQQDLVANRNLNLLSVNEVQLTSATMENATFHTTPSPTMHYCNKHKSVSTFIRNPLVDSCLYAST